MTHAIGRDLRLALRGLRKQPRFVAIAGFTLALGIGAVTAIFSVVNGVLLKPLPYAEPDRLVSIWSNAAGLNLDQFPLSPDLYEFLRGETSSAFASMTTFRRRDVNLTESSNPEVVPAAETTASYFDTFRIAPARGQIYVASHDRPGAPLVAVVSHRLWQRRFGGDAGVVGRAVQIDGEAATIIGVLPAALDDNGSADLFFPARFDPAKLPTGTFGWNVAARLAPGTQAAVVAAAFPPIVRRFIESKSESAEYRAFLTDGHYRVVVHSLREDLVGDLQRPLWILLGTVGFVLLIACANVANLFLIRAEGRQREMAIRAALGGQRAALVRAQLVEAFVLAGVGGLLGVGGAAAAVPALVRAAPATIPRLNAVTMDWRVLLVAAGATAIAAIIFGIVPAVRSTRPGSLLALRQGGRGATVDKARHRGRRLLVVLQTALTLVLLVGSGLLVRSFARMIDADLGFDPRDTLTFRVALPRSSYADQAQVIAFESRMIEQLAALPGTTAAGAASNVPMVAGVPGTTFVIEGRPTPPGQLPPIIHYKYTSPGYVEAMGMRLLHGRTFDRRDLAAGSRDVLVNQAMADTFWPGRDPVGQRLRTTGENDDWYRVVGVVSSERHDGLRREPPVLIYFGIGAPFGDTPRALTYVIRGPQATRQASAARDAVWALDAHLPVAAIQPMAETVSRSIVSFTFTMLTLGVAALMALVLGTIGLYGVLAYTVTLRVREIGVRLALGAQPSRVMRSVVAQGLAIVAVGLVVGAAGAFALTRVLSGLLYETRAVDPATFAVTAGALLLVAAIASYLPARRAASVSPLESLRSE